MHLAISRFNTTVLERALRFLGSQRLLISPRQLEDPCPRLLPVGLRRTILSGLCRQDVSRSLRHGKSDDVRIVDIFVALLSSNCNHRFHAALCACFARGQSGSSSSWSRRGYQSCHRVVLTMALEGESSTKCTHGRMPSSCVLLATLFAICLLKNLSDFRIVLFFWRTSGESHHMQTSTTAFFLFPRALTWSLHALCLANFSCGKFLLFCPFNEQLKTNLVELNLRTRRLWIAHNQTLTCTSCSSEDLSSDGAFGLLACLRPGWMTQTVTREKYADPF